jgi:HlyD family secretion protein/epimerase transport system membrane fusion protein
LIAALFGGFGIWSATVPIASAIVANGQVVVASKRKQVQHPTGGVVRKIDVEDGSLVKAGDVLVELQDADAADRYTRTRDTFYLGMASEARLMAEALDRDMVTYPAELLAAAKTEASVKAIVDGQTRLFEVRRTEVRGQLSIIKEQYQQLKDEYTAVVADKAASDTQIKLTRQELTTVEGLFEQGYTTRTRLFSLRSQVAQLQGNAARSAAMGARTRSAMIENELKLVQATNQVMSALQNDLRDVQAKLPNLREQFHAASLAFNGMTIRAPVGGVVLASHAPTMGSVVRPGETILEIVPDADRLMIEVQVRPTDIDSVKVGLDTEVRFTGLSQRTVPMLSGHVVNVSADALQDPRTSATYFVAQVDVTDSELNRLGKTQLQPGMPAAVMIKTGERTALAYLTQPLNDSIHRAWRE